MAKKKKIVEEHKSEPVTNCDQSQEPVAKCDQLVKVDANGNHLDSGDIVLSQYDIEKLIITIRGKQVLIDRDLGKIYGVETKRLNEQVRRNMKQVYADYKDHGLQIVGVSCDKDHNAWIKALDKHQLPWTALLSPADKGDALDLYGVYGIPTVILIAPNGTIIAIDMESKELKAKLEEIFNDNN